MLSALASGAALAANAALASAAALNGAVALTSAAALASAQGAATPDATPSVRLVHRFLDVEISPDGKWVASVEGDSPLNGYYPALRQLVIRPVQGKGATQISLPCGQVEQCWPGFPAWTSDSRHLSFTLRKPGSHDYSIYTVEPDGAGLKDLLDFKGTLVDLRVLPDGRLAMLATEGARKEVGATEAGAPVAGDLDEAPAEQRIAILDHGALQWASPANLFVYEYDWRPDGKGFVGTAAPGNGDDKWWTARLYAFGSSEAAQIIHSPDNARQQIAMPRVSKDGRTVAFIGGLMSDFGSTGGDIFVLPIEGGAAINMTHDTPYTATSLAWGCKGHLMAKLLAGDKSEIADMGMGHGEVRPHILWSGQESISRHEAGLSWACSSSGITATAHDSFTAPPEIEAGKIGHWHDITAMNTGLTLPAHAQSLQWKSEGFDVQGWLLLPEHGSGKVPLITIIHGGPAAASEPSFRGPGLDQMLLERGYALFLPNPRGSYGQGERFTEANVRDFGHGDLRDVLAGIDAAEKAAPIDDTRLGVTGGSYGGFMTMWTVTQTNRFKAAVAAAGISDWLSYYGENGIDAWMIPYFGASAYDDPAIYGKSSAIGYIRNVRTPTFEYVGERDIECPAPQTQEFWHALKDLGVPTSIMIYPGEGHGLREPAHNADALRRTLEWFDRYLK
jgi:dipeptidyl aminopeptidase/acylaminoacyl peptidase